MKLDEVIETGESISNKQLTATRYYFKQFETGHELVSQFVWASVKIVQETNE